MTVGTGCLFCDLPPGAPDRVWRVVITRYHPRGLSCRAGKPNQTTHPGYDEYLPVLSPSATLLQRWKCGMTTWPQFIRDFVDELKRNPCALQAIQRLNSMTKKRRVLLLCYERDGEPCHRHLVRDLVLQPGTWPRGAPDNTDCESGAVIR